MGTAIKAPSKEDEQNRETSVSKNTRQCVVCRANLRSSALLPLGTIGAQLVFERPAKGRGAYICPTKSCLDKLSPAMVSRAFKRSVKMEGLGDLSQAAHSLASRRTAEALGLSRRQGAVKIGVDALKGQKMPQGGLRIVASDLSEHSAKHVADAVAFGTAEQLGKHMGLNRVGALSISPGPMADRVAFWLSLWQETLPTSAPGVTTGT